MGAEGEVGGVDASLMAWGEDGDGAGGGGTLEKGKKECEETDAGVVAEDHEGI